MEQNASENLSIDQKKLMKANVSKRPDYQQRSMQQQSQQKSSQMSISISVHNQSMRDMNKLLQSKDSKAMLKEIHSSNVPLDLPLTNLELENKNQSSSQDALDQQTLSISATHIQNSGQDKSNEAAVVYNNNNSGLRFTAKNDASTEQLNQTPIIPIQNEEQLQLMYASHQDVNKIDSAGDKMFEVDMLDDAQSQLVMSNNMTAPIRPVSHYDQRNNRANRHQNGVVVRKKRVKSTRPGGIRGGVLIQDKYSTNTPMSTKKTRLSSLRKFRGEQSSANMMLNQSTNAGSVNQQSSKLYMSYAPTGLVKVGNKSVQRLPPRMASSNNNQGFRPTTAAVRPLIPGHQLSSEYTSNSQQNMISGQVGINRPYSQFSRQQHNKFTSMKAAMQHDSNPCQYSFSSGGAIQPQQQAHNLTEQQQQQQQMTSEAMAANKKSEDFTQMNDLLQQSDGFKLVSQFENEQAAITYATQLQKYYDGLNMDVKVQIEANLTQLDDTEDKHYLQEAMEAYQQENNNNEVDHEDETSEQNQRLAKSNIKSAFANHFKKIDQVQLRTIKGVIKRDADLTDPKFQKRVDKKISKAEPIEYDKLDKRQIREVKKAQEQIFGVIRNTAKLPSLSYQNQGAQERKQAIPGFKFDKDIQKTQIKHSANIQAKILHKLGVLPGELQGEVQHASQVMSNDNKIPKSMAKFYQREQRLKKLFDAQVSQWKKETPMADTAQQSVQSLENTGQPTEPKFDVDVRLYKERGDDYCIIGNKMQYRASEENKFGQNYSHKQALETKSGFDPIRICLRIMPISRAPLAQGKTPDYYFREAAKKSLSGDLTNAVEQLKRGLIINPNHFICRFNHGVLMFKFGLIREASKDFQQLTHHPHGMRDPWVFYNFATCLIQLGQPENPLHQKKQREIMKRQTKTTQKRLSKAQEKISLASAYTSILHSDMSDFNRTIELAQITQYKQDKGTENYLKAIEMCSKAYDLGAKTGKDQLIMLDALKLKGICLYRLGELIESVKVLYKARMLQKKIDMEREERRKAIKHHHVDEVVGGFFTVSDYRNINKRRSKSFQQHHHKMRLPKKQKKNEKRDHSWTNYELDLIRIKTYQEQNQVPEESSDNESTDRSVKTTTNSAVVSSPMSAVSNASRRMVEQARQTVVLEIVQDEENSRSHALLVPAIKQNKIISSDTMRVSQIGSKRDSQEKSQNSVSELGSRREISSAHTIQSKVSNIKPEKNLRFNLNKDNKEQDDSQFNCNLNKALERRFTDVRKKIIDENKRYMNENKIEELMQKLSKQRESLAADRKMLKMTKYEYGIFRKTYIDLRKQSDACVDSNDPMLRMKNIYLKQFDEDEEEYEDCNTLEIAELQKRKCIAKWINEDDLIMQLIKDAALKLQNMSEVGVDPVEAALNERFVEHLLAVACVNLEEVSGTHIETLLDIVKDQSQMDSIMSDLRFKVTEMCRQFEKELNRGIEELTAIEPKLDEMKILRGERHIDVEDHSNGIQDKMITRLQDALINDSTTPDEVINVLTTDNFEKEKLKLQLQYMNGASDDEEDDAKIFIKRKQIAVRSNRRTEVRQDMRYTERHIEMIKNQFLVKGVERKYSVLEKLMRHLRFIKRHDPEVRKQIYKHAEYVEYPAQYVIFKKGEEADYMYIILKGRVSCESTHPQYTDIPSIVATVKDGEAFGELAVVNQKQVQVELRESGYSDEIKQPKRIATCKTVEVSRMIRILAHQAKKIVQPTVRKEQDQSTISINPSREVSSLESVTASIDGIAPPMEMRDYSVDELNQKLLFLQSFEMFRDFKSNILIPVALSMDTVKFRYGEFLTRAGDRPPGMYLIKSGQCVVGLTQTSTRPKNYRDIPGQREPIYDKNTLFNRFDPENSLLNNVEIQDRMFQNGRIYVENNEQIRDKIMYHDFIQFSKLFPKNQFGGRCLIPFDIYQSLKRSYFGPQSLVRPVVVESTKKVQEMTIPKQMMAAGAVSKNSTNDLNLHLKQHKSKDTSDSAEEPSRQQVNQKQKDNEPPGENEIKKQETYHMKSFLDVVANSACVEAFLITKQGIEYLSGQNLKNIYECIVQEKEPDRPYMEEKIMQKKNEMLISQAESLDTVKRIMWENKIEKYGVMAVKETK